MTTKESPQGRTGPIARAVMRATEAGCSGASWWHFQTVIPYPRLFCDAVTEIHAFETAWVRMATWRTAWAARQARRISQRIAP